MGGTATDSCVVELVVVYLRISEDRTGADTSITTLMEDIRNRLSVSSGEPTDRAIRG